MNGCNAAVVGFQFHLLDSKGFDDSVFSGIQV